LWTVVLLWDQNGLNTWTNVYKCKTSEFAIKEAKEELYEINRGIERLQDIKVVACFRGELQNHVGGISEQDRLPKQFVFST